MIRLGIDIGGTFTDFVVFNPAEGSLHAFKVPSTPEDPSRAVLMGLQNLTDFQYLSDLDLVHGSTVATNALLERKGASTALVTTRGFRDVLQIGRQDRPLLYDLNPRLPPPLVPDNLRFEVEERVGADGEVLTPLDSSEVESLLSVLEAQADHHSTELSHAGGSKVESVAVCLLFSFLHPHHEARIARRLREAGFFVSASHEVLPEYREYERTATTVINAYVSPVMDRYLAKLEASLPDFRLRVMQSNGGSISPHQARREAVRCILSGPAGGVVAAQNLPTLYLSRRTEREPADHGQKGGAGLPISNLITFDMGGTSTDVSLIHGTPRTTTEAEIGGLPVRVPTLDIHTIGAGGGSIAHVDPGGALRVGPGSAGAHPGPACYGLGGEDPTVTDANLTLGRLDPERFLGGKMPLSPDRAQDALAPLALELGLTPVEAALGIIEVANAHMERALRVISVARGHDPRDFTLVSFGGAGGLHAAALARRLGIPRVIISPYAATFSALGMLMADVVKDYTQTVMFSGSVPLPDIKDALQPLLGRGRADLLAESLPEESISLEQFLDVRYRGQSYELTVPFTERWRDAFMDLHRREYEYALQDGDLEIVNLRVRAVGALPVPEIPPQPLEEPDPSRAFIDRGPVMLERAGKVEIPHYLGEGLRPGNRIAGPALILRSDTTVLINRDDLAEVDPFGNVIVIISP